MDETTLMLVATTLCAAATLYVVLSDDDNDNKVVTRKRKYKTRLINRGRKKCGFFNMYFKKMKDNDDSQFFKYTRMNRAQFEYLLKGTAPMTRKQKTKDGISSEERLALTLHYLSQGCSMQSIAWKYHMGHTTVHKIIKETCEAIYTFLSPYYLKSPSSTAEWLEISKGFMDQWNFPNCIGALDGKHIAMQAPGKSGNLYFNYKKHFSTVLLASCDANYIFRMVDIGSYGSNSDGGIFRQSAFGELLDQGLLHVPPPSIIPGTNIMQPYVIVADEAFPLKSCLIRPYPGRNLSDSRRIFNYRLSRARRCIENAFGIMTNRWRLLRTTIVADVHNIDSFIKAIVCLHNFLRFEELLSKDNKYCPQEFVDCESNKDQGSWRDEDTPLPSVGRLASNRASRQDIAARDSLCNYFMTVDGSVPWQHEVLTSGFI